jgi:hypothetical protein
MENRERDRVSQRTTPTEAGEINRRTEESRRNSGSGVEFGENIGRSEDLRSDSQGDTMQNRDSKQSNRNEESRRPSGESGYGSSGRRSGSMGGGSMNRDSEMNENQSDRSRRGGSMGNIGNSDEGRH